MDVYYSNLLIDKTTNALIPPSFDLRNLVKIHHSYPIAPTDSHLNKKLNKKQSIKHIKFYTHLTKFAL